MRYLSFPPTPLHPSFSLIILPFILFLNPFFLCSFSPFCNLHPPAPQTPSIACSDPPAALHLSSCLRYPVSLRSLPQVLFLCPHISIFFLQHPFPSLSPPLPFPFKISLHPSHLCAQSNKYKYDIDFHTSEPADMWCQTPPQLYGGNKLID